MIKYFRNKLSQWELYKKSLHQKNKITYHLVDTIEVIIVALAMALLARHFVIQTSLVPTGSMIPTMQIQDRLFVNKFIYRFTPPHRGNIIVFKSPFNDGKDFVKRCIGLPGEKIEIKKGEIYINNRLLVFPGVNIQNDYSYFGPVTIPKDSYFMMGDNRGNSLDSRYWGFVPRKDILGKAMFTFWPLRRMQALH